MGWLVMPAQRERFLPLARLSRPEKADAGRNNAYTAEDFSPFSYAG